MVFMSSCAAASISHEFNVFVERERKSCRIAIFRIDTGLVGSMLTRIVGGIDKLVRVPLFRMVFARLKNICICIWFDWHLPSWMLFLLYQSFAIYSNFYQIWIQMMLLIIFDRKIHLTLCQKNVTLVSRRIQNLQHFHQTGFSGSTSFLPRKYFQMTFYWNINNGMWNDMPCANLRLGLSEIEIDMRLRAETSTRKLLRPMKLFIQVFLPFDAKFSFPPFFSSLKSRSWELFHVSADSPSDKRYFGVSEPASGKKGAERFYFHVDLFSVNKIISLIINFSWDIDFY